MSPSSDESSAQLEDQLDGASRTLSSLRSLDAREAERVAARMGRLASQLLEVSPPITMASVHDRSGTKPASREDFASIVDEMGSADREG